MKTFDKDCFLRNDKLAKDATKIAFKDFDVRDNPDRYGVDLLLYKNNEHIGYVECERAESYWNYEGPFKGHLSELGERVVRFPSRKAHFLSKDKSFFFLIVNSLSTDVLIVARDTLKDNYWKEDDKSRYGKEGDYFLCLPINLCRQISIKSRYNEYRAKRVENEDSNR